MSQYLYFYTGRDGVPMYVEPEGGLYEDGVIQAVIAAQRDGAVRLFGFNRAAGSKQQAWGVMRVKIGMKIMNKGNIPSFYCLNVTPPKYAEALLTVFG